MSMPRILLTMGDVAGIGPEIIAKAWPQLQEQCRPIVVGDPDWLECGLSPASISAKIQKINRPEEAEPNVSQIPCLNATKQDLSRVKTGQVCAEAGRAAYDFLSSAIDLTMAKRADAIVTAPLHTEGLRAAGTLYYGHTEILAEGTGAQQFAMELSGR